MTPDTTLIDDVGITWVRQRCRCCGAILWETLGDPVGLCRRCAVVAAGDPLGDLRLDREIEYLQLVHVFQYHGACAMDV
ncbi:MAG TPA: hypothetical protein VFI31_00810 [Pirellulales bacterium]|nr:hypothetical protein [Pirellulales bacterium]